MTVQRLFICLLVTSSQRSLSIFLPLTTCFGLSTQCCAEQQMENMFQKDKNIFLGTAKWRKLCPELQINNVCVHPLSVRWINPPLAADI